MTGEFDRGGWTFLTNHAHVMLCIAGQPDVRMRELALRVGITERAVQRIVSDLVDGGYLEAEKQGRTKRYRIRPELPLRHPVEAHRKLRDLLELVDVGQ